MSTFTLERGQRDNIEILHRENLSHMHKADIQYKDVYSTTEKKYPWMVEGSLEPISNAQKEPKGCLIWVKQVESAPDEAAPPQYNPSSRFVIVEDLINPIYQKCPLCIYDENGVKKTDAQDRPLMSKCSRLLVDLVVVQDQKESRPDEDLPDYAQTILKVKTYRELQGFVELPSELDLHYLTVHNCLDSRIDHRKATELIKAFWTLSTRNLSPPVLTNNITYKVEPTTNIPPDALTKDPLGRKRGSSKISNANTYKPLYFEVSNEAPSSKQDSLRARIPSRRNRVSRALLATAFSCTALGIAWLSSGDNFQRTLTTLGLRREEASFWNCYNYC